MPWTVYNSDGQILQGSSTLADDAVTTAKILNANVTLAKMAANSIDSDQYVDASIDNAHLADDAVGVAELSATGTASSSTFLRGDNAWAAAATDISAHVTGAGQSISTGAEVTVAFNAERFDTDGIHDNSTNNSRLTCKTAGKYIVVFHASLTSNTTGRRKFWIRKNGSGGEAAIAEYGTTQGGPTNGIVTTILDLSVDDYVEARVYQTSGSTLTLSDLQTESPEFMMAKVG
jgi:hypothetical protein